VRLVQRYGPAVRVAEPSMVVRVGTSNRISGSRAAVEGARQFVAKHAPAMRAEHLRSQHFVAAATAQRRLAIRDVLACWHPANAGSVFRYWLLSNVPGARTGREWLWKTRWPAGPRLDQRPRAVR
jgi:hypothetical protein